MGDMMTFPKRWEDFLHDYEFEDARRNIHIITAQLRSNNGYRIESFVI